MMEEGEFKVFKVEDDLEILVRRPAQVVQTTSFELEFKREF